MSTALIEVKNLRRQFDDVTAVDDVSFELYPGEIVGFVGANGAGKTTTMRMMVTLDIPDGGSIFVEGVDAVAHPACARSRIGWMPDAYGVYDQITVWEYLDFYGRALGFRAAVRRQRIDDVMEFTDLTPLAERYVGKLSKGMGQRLCLGRTLLHDPPVLILDEPAAGLDPKARVELKNLLRLLSGEGKTIFISSHILSELGEMCQRLLFIDRGKIVHQGSADSLLHSDEERLIVRVELCGEVALLEQWVAMQQGVSIEECYSQGARIALEKADPLHVHQVLQRMVRDGLPVVEYHRERRKLEDAFIDMLDKIGLEKKNGDAASQADFPHLP